MTFDRLENMIVFVTRLPRQDAGAGGRVETPQWCNKNKGVRNIESPDGKCFTAAVMCALVSRAEMEALKKHHARFTSYTAHPLFREIDWSPVNNLSAVDREHVVEFQKANPWLSITTYGIALDEDGEPESVCLWGGKKPLKVVKKLTHDGEVQRTLRKVNLLLIRSGPHGAESQDVEIDPDLPDNSDETGHYATITDVSKFMHPKGSETKRTIQCPNCTHTFDYRSMDKLAEHVDNDCLFATEIFPKAGTVVQFVGSHAVGAVQVCRANISCDFETTVTALTDKMSVQESLEAVQNPQSRVAKTTGAATLRLVSFALTVKTLDDNALNNQTISKLVTPDSTEFLDALAETAEHLSKTMPHRDLDKTGFLDSLKIRAGDARCCVCDGEFAKYNQHDHCPPAGKDERNAFLAELKEYTSARSEMRKIKRKLVGVAERNAWGTESVTEDSVATEVIEEVGDEEVGEEEVEETENTDEAENTEDAPAPTLKRRFTWLSPATRERIDREAGAAACAQTGFKPDAEMDEWADGRNAALRNMAKWGPVDHHCHIHGMDCKGKTDHGIFGLCHQDCNKRMQLKNEANCWFHNGRGFDFHYVLKMLGSWQYNGEAPTVRVLPATRESFREMRVTIKLKTPDVDQRASKKEKAQYRKEHPGCSEGDVAELTRKAPRKFTFVFRDSLAHFMSSLDSVSSRLKPEQRIATDVLARKITGNDAAWYKEVQALFCKKGGFPYSWLSDMSKLSQTSFPSFAECQNELLPGPGLSLEKHTAMAEAFVILRCKDMAEHLLYYKSLT